LPLLRREHKRGEKKRGEDSFGDELILSTSPKGTDLTGERWRVFFGGAGRKKKRKGDVYVLEVNQSVAKFILPPVSKGAREGKSLKPPHRREKRGGEGGGVPFSRFRIGPEINRTGKCGEKKSSCESQICRAIPEGKREGGRELLDADKPRRKGGPGLLPPSEQNLEKRE